MSIWSNFWDWLFSTWLFSFPQITCPKCYEQLEIYPPAGRAYCPKCHWMNRRK